MKTTRISEELWLFRIQFGPSFSYKSKDEENGFLWMYERRTREIRKLLEKLGDEEDKCEMEAAIADVYRKVNHN